jgi:hypothetical protein
MITMTIEKDITPDSWYQAYLIINDLKTSIGRACFDYNDCRINAEKIVEEFAKKNIYVMHSHIYDLM